MGIELSSSPGLVSTRPSSEELPPRVSAELIVEASVGTVLPEGCDTDLFRSANSAVRLMEHDFGDAELTSYELEEIPAFELTNSIRDQAIQWATYILGASTP